MHTVSKQTQQEAFGFWQRRFKAHRRDGLTRAQARRAANADAEEKYGVDWPTIFKLLEMLLKLFSLFG